MVRFQVLGSTVGYHNSILPNGESKGEVSLAFDVFPFGCGEFKFSDGNRLVGQDLNSKWGETIYTHDLYGKTDRDPDVFHDGGKWPISTTVMIRRNGFEPDWIKNDEFSCGYAWYASGKYTNSRLTVFIGVPPDAFSDLLQIRIDSPGKTFIDVGIAGLKYTTSYGHETDSIDRLWDLSDIQNCGRGDCRIITEFSFGREIRYFPDDGKIKRLERERAEDKDEQKKLRSRIEELVAIGNGTVNGALEKLLRLNLLLLLIIGAIGAVAFILR